MPKVLLGGLAAIAIALTFLALLNARGTAPPGANLLLEFLVFLALFPALMGLFASPPAGDAGRRIAEREARQGPG